MLLGRAADQEAIAQYLGQTCPEDLLPGGLDVVLRPFKAYPLTIHVDYGIGSPRISVSGLTYRSRVEDETPSSVGKPFALLDRQGLRLIPLHERQGNVGMADEYDPLLAQGEAIFCLEGVRQILRGRLPRRAVVDGEVSVLH
jgi:hypothetical protein